MENRRKLKVGLVEALREFLAEEIDWDGKTPFMALIDSQHAERVAAKEELRKEILSELQALGASEDIRGKVEDLENATSFTVGNAAEVAYIQGYLDGQGGQDKALAGIMGILFRLETAREEAIQ